MTTRVALCLSLAWLVVGVAHGQERPEQLVDRLIADLHSEDPRTRRSAAQDLGKAGKEHPNEVVPALARALDDKDAWVRQGAVRGLWLIGPPAKPAVSTLTNLLSSASGTARTAILDALAAIGIAEGVPQLVSMIEQGPEEVRPGAIRALGEIGPDAADAVPTLIGALTGIHGDEARDALGKIGPAALPPLREALASPQPRVRALAAEAHGAIGSAAAPAVPRLIELLADEDKKVRRGAAVGLAGIGPPALPALLDALGGDGDEGAEQALEWLGKDHSQAIRNWAVIPRAYALQLLAIALFTVVWFVLVRRSVMRGDGKVGFGLAYSLPTAVACAFGYYVVEQHWTHSYMDRGQMTYAVVATALFMGVPATACGLWRRPRGDSTAPPASEPPASGSE